jgi:eukaryotic-like serine/threonine-protein kinase
MSHELDEALITRLLDLPAIEREASLRRVSIDRPDLKDRLDRIRLALVTPVVLSAGKSPAGPSSVADFARIMEFALETPETTSAMIGPYKLLQKLGEGGFGTVWMAEQTSPVRRRVAVKVIKSGMDTREVIARFEAERQALALMDHPNIARVFNAGETDAGRPYFVMELVRGIPVTKYCDETRLATRERLDLFVAICHAVQHAHQKGIIHRDLKPSNIIVTLHDGVAVPKIIDFGIAKATGTRLTEKTLFTQFHAFIGTPAYTSPEQMEMSGLDVDTRSDIYSLGVLLYELLAGRPPFDPDRLQKSGLEEMRRTIREVDPLRPSQSVGTLSEELRTTVAWQRGTDPAKLSVLLRGDLDWIVMHCLEKDRTRRYATASDVAADVRRSLANEPIVARPPSAPYRLRKFVQRHRVGFFAGMAVGTSLLAALVMSSISLVRERAAREREAVLRIEADASALKARVAAARSDQTARFMKAMLESVGPSVALGRDTTMLQEIADRTAHRLETELHDQPEVAAELRETLGGVYRDLGQYAAAEPLLREAAAMSRARFGSGSAELAAALDNWGVVLRRFNKTAEAETALQEAVQIRRRVFGEQHLLFADSLFHLAQVWIAQRSLDEMETMVKQVLAVWRLNLPGEHPAIAEALSQLGTIAREKLDHVRAVELHSEAVAMQRKLLGDDHPAVAEGLESLSYSLSHIGRIVEARAAYREAFNICRKVLGDAHPRTVAALVLLTGEIPAAAADEDTVRLVREFIAHQKQLLPPGSVSLAPSLLALASLLDLSHQEKNSEAIQLRDEARMLLEASRLHGPRLDVEIISAMYLFGWWKFVNQAPAEGIVMNEEALLLARAAYGSTSSRTVFPNHILAWLYLGAGRTDDAIAQFQEAIHVIRPSLGAAHQFTGMDVAGLGAAYREAGRVTDSRNVLEEILGAWRSGTPNEAQAPPSIAIVLGELGFTLNREGRFVEAERVFRDSLSRYNRGSMIIGQRIRPRARVTSGLGLALIGQGKFGEAEPLVVQAFDELNASRTLIFGDAKGTVREALDAVITLYGAWGKSQKLAEWKAKLNGLTSASQ